jgi:hypothetical protein
VGQPCVARRPPDPPAATEAYATLAPAGSGGYGTQYCTLEHLPPY